MYQYNLYKTVRRYGITLHHNLHHNYSLTERLLKGFSLVYVLHESNPVSKIRDQVKVVSKDRRLQKISHKFNLETLSASNPPDSSVIKNPDRVFLCSNSTLCVQNLSFLESQRKRLHVSTQWQIQIEYNIWWTKAFICMWCEVLVSFCDLVSFDRWFRYAFSRRWRWLLCFVCPFVATTMNKYLFCHACIEYL